MVHRNFAAILALCLLSSTRATEELTPDRFKQLTTSGQNGMVKFYQPVCIYREAFQVAPSHLVFGRCTHRRFFFMFGCGFNPKVVWPLYTNEGEMTLVTTKHGSTTFVPTGKRGVPVGGGICFR